MECPDWSPAWSWLRRQEEREWKGTILAYPIWQSWRIWNVLHISWEILARIEEKKTIWSWWSEKGLQCKTTSWHCSWTLPWLSSPRFNVSLIGEFYNSLVVMCCLSMANGFFYFNYFLEREVGVWRREKRRREHRVCLTTKGNASQKVAAILSLDKNLFCFFCVLQSHSYFFFVVQCFEQDYFILLPNEY